MKLSINRPLRRTLAEERRIAARRERRAAVREEVQAAIREAVRALSTPSALHGKEGRKP